MNTVKINGVAWATENLPDYYYFDEAKASCPTGFRLPTVNDFGALLDKEKVSQEWTEIDGVSGLKFTDKETGATIFLPAAGIPLQRRRLAQHLVGYYGLYWSSTGIDSYYAYLLYFSSDYAYLYDDNRRDGLSVRPVAE